MHFFQESEPARELRERLLRFMDAHIYPNDGRSGRRPPPSAGIRPPAGPPVPP